jgi:pimeloyl-ACP methyl ester carboxylesterase
MLRLLAVVGAVLCIAACSSAPPRATPTSSQPPVKTPSLPASGAFDNVYGSYRTDSGDVLVVTRMGWFADLGDSTYRTLYAFGSPGRFSIGPGFEQATPVVAELQIGSDSLTLSQAGRTIAATKLNLKRSEVTIHADGADLAGTITEPDGSGPHPGIVIVHGSEPGQRYYYDFWVGLYTSLGLAVLTYDKRGQGASTGRYPGEYASQQALTTYADDAIASLAVLARWPGIDAKRVGFHGGSQGGWIVPLAISRHGLAAFAILASAPAVTVDQQGIWSAFTGGGARLPSQSPQEMYAAVGANHTGYDPAPALASLDMPVLWILGRNDRTVPTDICVENLNLLQKPNLRIQLVDSGHGLLFNQTGLNADDKTSPGLAPGVVSSISDWIRQVT